MSRGVGALRGGDEGGVPAIHCQSALHDLETEALCMRSGHL